MKTKLGVLTVVAGVTTLLPVTSLYASVLPNQMIHHLSIGVREYVASDIAHVSVVPKPVVVTPTAPVSDDGYGCGPALTYLSTHAAPGFRLVCPGYSLGEQAMTCIGPNRGCAAGVKEIVITVPCPAAYMNEAYNSNSWDDGTRTFTRPIDPYGYCH